jgi:hypothetical protein
MVLCLGAMLGCAGVWRAILPMVDFLGAPYYHIMSSFSITQKWVFFWEMSDEKKGGPFYVFYGLCFIFFLFFCFSVFLFFIFSVFSVFSMLYVYVFSIFYFIIFGS